MPSLTGQVFSGTPYIEVSFKDGFPNSVRTVTAGPQFGVRYLHNGVWSEYSTEGFHSSSLKANALFVDRDGSVWIATENDGLYRVSGGVVDHFSKADGLSGRNVGQIMEDHEGNLWASTDGGRTRYN